MQVKAQKEHMSPQPRRRRRLALLAALGAVVSCVVAMSGSAASFDDTYPCPAQGPYFNCPAAQLGQPYSLQLTGKGGCDRYRWELRGEMPPGMTITASGLVSGTPTAVGETHPWLIIHDLTKEEGGYSWCGGDNHSERQFKFLVAPGLAISAGPVAGGTVGQPYSASLSATSVTSVNQTSGAPVTATWSLQSGSLPPGMTFSTAGVIAGTPTSEGSYSFVVRAAAGDVSATKSITLTVRRALAVSSPLQSAPEQALEVGLAYSLDQSATGGDGNFQWAIGSGALPAGLELSGSGGVSGVPARAGRYPVTFKLTDGEARSVTLAATFTVAAKLQVSRAALKPARLGRPWRAQLRTTGGVAPTTWSIRGRLPAGVTFGADSGRLAGTPHRKGTYKLVVEVSDSLGAKASRAVTITVKR
jgi:hypothetical protein